MSALYEDRDENEMQKDAASCLLKYCGGFHPDIITRASGHYIYTATGHRMLDWTSGQMSCLIGHGHPEVVEVIKQHAESLDHVFSTMITPPVIDLAKRLTSLTPPGLDKALFLSTGGESNEAAIRLAKFYTGKLEIVGLSASWHGITGGALGAQYQTGRSGYGPIMPGNFALPAPNAYRSIFRHADGTHDWRTELDYGFDLIDRQSCGSLAAVIVEPILASGGVHPLPPGYLSALRAHCIKRDMLIICDEAQTALGRAGDMFAFQHHNHGPDAPDTGFIPDILTLSKTLGNGIPLSALLTSNAIANYAAEKKFFLYTTHLNDPLPAAVGAKVLDIVTREDNNLITNSRRVGAVLHAGLVRLQSRYGCIGDVRGRGLMYGVEIVTNREAKTPGLELGERIAKRMAELGLWAKLGSQMGGFSGTFRFALPVTSGEGEVREGLECLERALEEAEGSLKLC